MAETAHGHAGRKISVSPPVSDMRQRLLITAALLAIAFATTYVPAPGINLEVLGGPAGALATNTGTLARLSITALWFTPVLSALLLTEALKLVVPPQSALPEKNKAQQAGFNRFMLVVALVLAAFQAYGLAVALEGIEATGNLPMVEEPGAWFRVPFILTQVAGVALLIALADQITRHGIGSGFWVIIAAGEISGLGTALAALLDTFKSGLIHGGVLLALAAVSIAAIAATVALYRAYVRPSGNGGEAPLSAADILIPPLLGAALAQLVYGFKSVLSFLSGEQVSPEFSYAFDDPTLLVLTGLMILLVAFLRVKKPYSVLSADDPVSNRPALVAGMAMAALTIALAVVSARAGVQPLSVPILAAITLVFLCAYPDDRERLAAAANPSAGP